MWKNVLFSFVTVAAFSLGSSLGAQAQAIPPTFPVKAPDMTPMHYLMGKWTCRSAGMMSTLDFTQSADGMWMLGTGSMALSSGGNQSSHLFMTFDPQSNRWVMMSGDSGGRYAMSFSSGWQADTLTWKPEMMGGGEKGDITMQRMSDTQLQITQNMPDKTGYQKMTTFTCTKAS